MSLAEATAVHSESGGRYRGEVQPGWDIAGAANGGYLMAIAANAVMAQTGCTDPLTVTAHYLSPAQPGPVHVDVTPLREGRKLSSAVASVRTADGTPLLASLATVATSAPTPGQEVLLAEGSPPELPPPDECVRVAATDTFPPPFMGRVDLRLHPQDVVFATGQKSGQAVVRGWFGLLGGEPLTGAAVLVAADAFPPPVFNTALPIAWTPTVELTVHVRARPVGPMLACVFRTRFVAAGYLEADGELWDVDGHLVALSRQLALVPRTGSGGQ
jgi:acyl-CoA thioesterase